MIYFDNAATSRFKPQAVIDAINYDLRHSANSGRSGHRDAVNAGIRIEECRSFLKRQLGADDDYETVFTKNCTEALNLAIRGSIKGGEHVLTTTNEHNSVLRPLYELERQKLITLDVYDTHGKKIDLKEFGDHAKNADIIVVGGACNVTGVTADLYQIGRIAKRSNAMFIVDGAQSVPSISTDILGCGVDMLACPGHKGLHGVQGTGFLIFKKSLSPKPLLVGGTGTFSSSVYQPPQTPDGLEAGTQFAGGIYALSEGAKWSFTHIAETRKNYSILTQTALYNLKTLDCALYSDETATGVIAFNVGDTDSSFIAEQLDNFGIAVRSGLHCAPLVHKALGTQDQGAVRISFGVESTMKDLNYFCKCLEKIIRKLK